MQKTKLYVLKTPETDEIRYVGITFRKLQQRLSGHLSDVKNRPDLNNHKTNWIKKIQREGKLPIIELVKEYDSLDEAKLAEIDYIEQYKELYKLTNATKGGDHLGNRCYTRETILKRKTTRAIKQYNIFGELLRTFDITEDAVKFLKLTSASKITMCCKKSRKHAHGYVWRYLEDDLGNIEDINKNSLSFNSLIQYTLEGKYVNQYNSYLTAASAVDDKSKGGNISSACMGKQRQSKGFVWELEPNFEYIDESFLIKKENHFVRENKSGKSGKKVNKFTLTNEFIEQFDTVSKASIDVLGTTNGRKAISDCCNNKRDNYKNFIWKWENTVQ